MWPFKSLEQKREKVLREAEVLQAELASLQAFIRSITNTVPEDFVTRVVHLKGKIAGLAFDAGLLTAQIQDRDAAKAKRR